MTDISKLRSEIDAIDDKIIALFNERSAIVKNVGKIKKATQKSGISYIRSGREADLIRSIYKKFKDNIFPANAAVQIWRIIISASLTLESDLTVAVCDQELDDRTYWLTREYFGNFLPISRRKNAKDVIQDVMHGNVQVGVLPITGEAWWMDLPEHIKIFACVPFILQHTEHQAEALAMAKIEPEATQDDIVLLKLTADRLLSQNEIAALFAKHEVKTRLLDNKEHSHLVELTGLAKENARIIPSVMQETGFAVTALGCYATPLKI